MDRETVITHLQIIHTWAEFARERDLQFFTAKHLEDIAQWSSDALVMIEEQKQMYYTLEHDWKMCRKLLKEQETVEHAKEILCANDWEKMRFPEGTIGKWDDPEIVRCKDCKHWYFADNRIPSEQENVCGRNGVVVTPDWYCADGERR